MFFFYSGGGEVLACVQNQRKTPLVPPPFFSPLSESEPGRTTRVLVPDVFTLSFSVRSNKNYTVEPNSFAPMTKPGAGKLKPGP